MTTNAISASPVNLPRSVGKAGAGALVLGGLTVSVLAAKSILVVSAALPLVGVIIGIAMTILGGVLYLQAGFGEYPTAIKNKEPSPRPTTEFQPYVDEDFYDLEGYQYAYYDEFTPFPTDRIDRPIFDITETPSEESESTSSDKTLAASNLLQWGLVGASLWGVAPAVTGAIGLAAGIGSSIQAYRNLPEDASIYRKVMTLPMIWQNIAEMHPVISGISKASSIYHRCMQVKESASKLYQAWKTGKAKDGAVHLFNAVSGTAFAAESAGLIALKPSKTQKADPKTRQCRPKALANHPCSNCGMFATNLYLVGVMDRFDKGQYSGVKVDFGKNGLYYDPSRGPNWFEYYFSPVDLEDKNCPNVDQKTFTDHELGDLSSYAERVFGYEKTGLPPERAKLLIEKYLPLRPELQNEIDQFIKAHFSESDYVVGVHYRGTDKIKANAATGIPVEARPVSYQEMTSRIQEQITQLKPEDQARVKIFAASDEEGFINHISKLFSGKVVTSPAKRSTNGKPLHFNAQDPYQSGKEALIDSQLLGKLSNVLIRTSSNLSKFSSLLLREGAKTIEVSKRLYQDPACAH